MKKNLLLLLGFVVLSSFAVQNSFKERMQKAVTPYVEAELGIDLQKSGNTLTIIAIDTLTEKQRLQLKGKEKLDELEISHLPFIELQRHAVNQYMLLYRIHPEKKVRDEIDKAVREYGELESKAAPLIQELEEIIQRQKTADDAEFLAYKVSGLLSRQTKDKTIKTDTIGLIVSKDLQVIKTKDFIKN